METTRILVVDDEEAVRVTLSRWFSLHGYETDTALDGSDALQRCQERDYDIVVLDRDMRRMGGLEALPLLKDGHPDMPIIILTGHHRDADVFLQQGATRVCFKPIRLEHLEQIVRETLIHAACERICR